MIVMLILGELIIRWLKPQQLIYINENVWQSDTIVGWKHTPNVNLKINTGEQEVNFRTDSNGFRINVVNNRTDSAINILAIGDSFVEAIQVENENTMNEKLRKKLSEKGINTTIRNTGVGGWSMGQYYLQAKNELARVKYNLGIVYIFIGNDFADSFDTILPAKKPDFSNTFKIPLSFDKNEWIRYFLYPINNKLEMKSHLFVLFKKTSKIVLAKLGLTAYYFPDIFLISEANNKKIETLKVATNTIKKIFEEYNTPLIFVLIPESYQVNTEIFNEYVKMFNIERERTDLYQPNKIARQVIGETKCVLLDPIEYYKSLSKNGQSLYFKTDNHFNENGHEALANFILQSVDSTLNSK